jgi:hypothetical protein
MSSRWYEDISPDALRNAAQLIVAQHRSSDEQWRPGRCSACIDGECRQLVWAAAYLAGQPVAYPIAPELLADTPAELDLVNVGAGQTDEAMNTCERKDPRR